jgi:xylulokinase
MGNQLVMAHDLGTSGNKATLFTLDGEMIGSCFESYQTFYPKPGWAEQDQEEWWQAFRKSSESLLAQIPDRVDDIVALSFSAQMMGCSPVTAEGKPLYNAIIWSDQRAAKQKEHLTQLIGDDDSYTITGTVMIANYLAAKILWLKEHYPDVYKNTYKFLQAKDYIILKLTGNFYTDYSDASGTNLFDIRAKKWSEEITKEADIDLGKLPDAVSSTTMVGKVTSEAARETGLPEGLPVIAGGGDGPCATVGAGASRPGYCYNVYGTSAWNSITTEEPLYDREKRTFIINHLDENLYMGVGTMQSAGGSYEWLNSWLGTPERLLGEEIGLSSFELMSMEAQKAEPCCHGALFLPYLMGERAPYWDSEVKGAFLGLNRLVGRPEIIRSVLEGTVFHLKLILDIIEENGFAVNEMRLIGGGNKSKFLNKLMADIWGKPVAIMKVLEEATSLGAAIAGFVGAGAISSIPEAESMITVERREYPDEAVGAQYSGFYEVFKQAYTALKDVNHNLDQLLRE